MNGIQEDHNAECLQASPHANPGTPEFVIDYGNIDQVANVLESNKVHTVISTIAVMNEVSGQSELDLVAAAAKSTTTRRFIASNYGGVMPSDE